MNSSDSEDTLTGHEVSNRTGPEISNRSNISVDKPFQAIVNPEIANSKSEGQSLHLDKDLNEGLVFRRGQTLDHKQVNFARKQIQEMHPLKKSHISAVWPFLLVFGKCCKCARPKKDFKSSLKNVLRRQMTLKVNKYDIQLEQNPFLRLGFGMQAYFESISQLALVFITATFLFMPVMCIYGSYDYFDKGSIDNVMLGNMGASSTVCNQVNLQQSNAHLMLTCPMGELNPWESEANSSAPILQIGVIPADANSLTYCSNNAFIDPYDCNQYLDIEAITAKLKAEGAGQKSFQIGGFDTDQWFKPTPNQELKNMCQGKNALVFMQVACTFSDEEVTLRQKYGLFIGSLAVFTGLFLMSIIDYREQLIKVKFLEYDMKTVTPSDFTIKFDIKPEFYKQFKDTHQIEKMTNFKNQSWVEYFMNWLTLEIEQRLTKSTDLGFYCTNRNKIKVAFTSIAFNNRKMIQLLRERGKYIKTEKWENMHKINEQITQEMNENHEEYSRPCTFFMCFRDEEGLQRALHYNAYYQQNQQEKNLKNLFNEIGGFEFEFQRADEPSDIIWENQHLTYMQRFKRELITGFVIALVLFASFIVIFAASKYNLDVTTKYPKQNCELFEQNTGQNLITFAYGDWLVNEQLTQEKRKTDYAGYLQCFCDKQKQDYNAPADQLYTATSFDGSFQELAPICKKYRDHIYLNLAVSNGMTVSITIVNMILTEVCIKWVTWISYPTHSKQICAITNSVFFSQFFNTGILIILVNANLFQRRPLLDIIFAGPFTDYTPQWYKECGYYIVQTMLITAFMPPIMQVISDVTRWIYHFLDKRPGSHDEDFNYNTKAVQIHQFIDLHLGPEYLVHFKYSSMLNVVYVTSLYAIGMPILFPIAALTFTIFWIHERYHVAYTYRRPPKLDIKVTQNTLKFMRFAPVLLLINGFWMLSNNQIFENNVYQIMYESDMMPTRHTLKSLFQFNQATPLLFLCSIFLIIVTMKLACNQKMKDWGFTINEFNLKVDESLKPFKRSLREKSVKWMMREILYYKNNYLLSLTSAQIISKLKAKEAMPKNPIHGIAWYSILANYQYQNEFCYISPGNVESNEQRNSLINDHDYTDGNNYEQSDMVKLVLDYGFLPDALHDQFNFTQPLKAQVMEMRVERRQTIKANLQQKKEVKQESAKKLRKESGKKTLRYKKKAE